MAALLAGIPLARAQPATPVQYTPVTKEPVVPAFSISSADSEDSVKLSVPWTWHMLEDPMRTDEAVSSYSIGPTVSFASAAKAPLLSQGDPSTPQLGVTKATIGVVLGYARETFPSREELAAIRDAGATIAAEAQRCLEQCATPDRDPGFCAFSRKELFSVQAVNLHELCPLGRQEVERRAFLDRIRVHRFQFPEWDVSVWAGAGAAQFKFYDQTAPATTTAPPMFSLTSAWHARYSAAAELVAVPVHSNAYGLTVELPLSVTESYQAGKKTASPCTVIGNVASDGTPLTSCGQTQPLDPPKRGALFTGKLDAGILDADKAYWRIAIGGGYTYNFVDSSTTWSIELPIYINATALGGSKDAKAGQGDGPAKTPVAFDYNGIVKVTPTLQHASSGGAAGWSGFLNLELLGQRRLFTRADSLVK